MLSKTALHTLKALVVLAQQPQGRYVGAADLATLVDAPPNYLSKVLQGLTDKGLVLAQRGRTGGFCLARSADKITLFDVVEPIDVVSRWSGCFLGNPRCDVHHPCAVHHRWSKVRDSYLNFLRETRLSDLRD